ncbi:MAG: TonB-dependent receptor [Methylophilaceae bacterium]
MGKKIKGAVAGIFSIAVCTCAIADDTNTFDLGKIQVTAPGQDAIIGIADVVDQDEMRLFNRETVGKSLNLLPGVTLTEGGARNEQALAIRGFDLRQVPVFVDGIPVYVSYDGYVDLGRFNTFDLSAIDLSKGFSSVLYGPNTLGGAINLISRKPVKELEGDITAGLYINRDLGYNGFHTDMNAGGNQGGWYWQLSASYLDKDQFQLSNDYQPHRTQLDGDRDNSYNQDRKLNLKIGWTPNETDEYSLNFITQHGEKGSPPYAGILPTTGPNSVGNRYWQWPYWDKDSLYFLSRTAVGKDSYLKLRAYYDKFENSITNFSNNSFSVLAARPFYQSKYDDYSYGGSTEFGTKLTDSNTLKLAAHFKKDVHREHNYVSNNAGTVNFNTPIQTDKDYTTSVGIEDTQRIGDKLGVVAGVSYDKRETLQAENYISGAGGNIGTIQPFEKGDASAWNPQIGLFYQLSATNEVHATVSEKSRFPTIKDRYSYRMGTAIPNAALQAESSTNYELGASGLVEAKTKLTTAIFFNNIRDMIQAVTITPTPTGCTAPCSQMQNVGRVHSKGIEIGLTSTLTDDLDIGANYTLLSRSNLTNPNIQFTDVPRQKLVTYFKWQVASPFSLLGSVEANSRRYSSSNGSQIASGFGIANLKGMYQYNEQWFVEAGVNNLLDKNYQLIEGYPMEGRNLFANATWKF